MSVLDFFGEEDTRITQLVYDISGSNANDQLGHSISIGLSGEIIAVGAPTSSQGGTERGLVRVYQKLTDLSGVSSWNQMGADLAGTSDNDQFGHSVDLNGDGTILAVGTKNTSNSLLVYNYDGSSWNQYGNTINLDNNTAFETSISHTTKGKLNYDGTKLVALNHNLGSSLVTTVTSNTVTHTSPYVTYGCTNNWDFRTVSSVGVTDDIGNIDVTYETGYNTSNAGSSTVENGFETDYYGSTGYNAQVAIAMKIQNGFTYGGSNWSLEFYINFLEFPEWGNLFRWHPSGYNYIEIARAGNHAWSIRLNGNSGTYITAAFPNGNSGTTGGKWWYDTNGQFMHLVFTISGGSVVIYHNGVSVGSGNLSNPANVHTSNDPNMHPLSSRLDQGSGNYPRAIKAYWRYFRYYHGKTLSASEVTDLYNDRDDTSTATGRDGTTPEGTNTITTTTVTTEYIQNDSIESFEYSSSTWNQLGNTIQSTSVNDISGGDIAINDAGNTIAIGYPEGKSAIASTYTYTVTAGSVFEFYGEEYTSDTANPALSFKRGSTYVLNINTTSLHPFWIQTSDNGGSYDSANVYSSGITNNGIYDGTITFVVPMDAPDTLYYRCGQHGNMGNSISITSALSKTGIAKVFQYNTTDSSWNQVGSNINGSGENDFFGSSIAMNTSGDFIAVGGPFAGDASAGHVKVYQNVNNTWNQAGNQIQGSSDNDQFGSAVDMNSDGKVIVVGAKNAESGKGSATVYQYKNTVTGYNISDLSWNRIGAGITGDSAGDFVGTSVGIIGEGTEFSVGAPGKQVDTNDNAGTVESYTFDYEKISDTEPRFTQILTPILGTAANDRMGEAVVTSLTGDVIAISAPNNSGGGVERGLVRVYQKGDSSWTQLGSDLTGTNDNDQFGYSLDINADGTILSVGTKDVSNNALYVYQYDGSTWNQYGNTIKVFKDNNLSFNVSSFIQGSKVKLNKEGNKLVTSNKYNVSNVDVVSNTVTHTSPYVTAGCTNNWDFRQNASAYVTDDIGGLKCWFYTDTDGYGNGTSDSTNGASVSLASNQQNVAVIDKGLFIDSGFTYGGVSSVEMYLYITECPSWSRFWYWGASSTTAYGLGATNTSSQKLTVYLNGTAVNGKSYQNYLTSQFTLNSWIHVVQTIDSGGEVKLYENGAFKASRSLGTTYLNSSIKTTTDKKHGAIGSYGDYNDARGVLRGLEAQYKYFRYYHGKALSASEVLDLYNDRDDTSTATGRDGTTTEGPTTVTTVNTTDYEEELVQVYEYSSPSWNQIGNSIESSSLHDISGGDIAINHSGDLIAVGYPNANGSSEKSGTTKIFKYDTNDASWNQVSDNINGSTTGDLAGTSLTFDMCDNYLGISSPFAGNNSEGSVNVYKITDNSWEHFGNIDGLTTNEQLGSIAMTPSAEIIAVGSKTAFDGAGVVRIYMKNSNLSNGFKKLSGDISGSTYTYNPTVQTETGSSIFLSEDGQIISVGEPGYNVGTDDNTGRVRVFNVDIPRPPVTGQDAWLYNKSTSNTLKSIYMKGMLEMDNAILRTRNEDNNLIGSVDASFNGGNVYLGETVKIGTETVKSDITLDVSGNTNISGNLKIIGDLSAISQINVDHVDISGDLITSGDTANINISSQNVTYDSELNITDGPLNVNKSKLSDNAGKVPITVENVLTTGNYSQIGETIYGYPSASSGVYINNIGATSINNAGDIIILGYGYLNAETARVYQYMTISEDDYNSGNTTGDYNIANGEIIIANGVAWSADTKFWVQLGGDINNSFINSLGSSQTASYTAWYVSINGTGDRIAVGSHNYDAFGSNNGAVFVLEYSTPGRMGGTWSLVGNIIGFTHLTETNITLGRQSMILSQDGNTILVSGIYGDTNNMPASMKHQEDDGNYSTIGPVSVFQYRTVTESEFNAGNTTTNDPNDGTPLILASGAAWSAENKYWVQLGNYIYIPYASAYPQCISMSDDGYRVMISSKKNTVSSNDDGSIHVFEYSNPGSITGVWNRMGGVIFGDETSGTGDSRTAYMSKDGNVVAFGQSKNDYTTASSTKTDFGVVRAMEYRLVSQTEWDNAKKAASGDIVTSQGVPLIYPDGDTNLNTTKKYWIQMGADIIGHLDSGNDTARYCLIGNTYNGYMLSIFSGFADNGKIYKFTTVSESEFNSRTYDNSNDSNVLFTNGESWESDKKFWVQIGDAIDRSATDDFFLTTAFSGDGTKMICTESSYDHTYPGTSTTLNSVSAVYVYEFDTESIPIEYNYQSIVTDVSASSPTIINAVYPPTTMSSINTDTINQFSGLITGQTYGNGNYTISCDFDNSNTVTIPARDYPPTAARDNFTGITNSTTQYIATTSGHSYGNGQYYIYLPNGSNWRMDGLYTTNGSAIYVSQQQSGSAFWIYFFFPEKFILHTIEYDDNGAQGKNWIVQVYSGSDQETSSLGTEVAELHNGEVDMGSSLKTLTFDSNNIAGDMIAIRLQRIGGPNQPRYANNTYFNFISKEEITTTSAPLSCLYNNAIADYNTNLHLLSTNTPTLTFTFPDSFILNNIYTVNNNCAQTWIVKAFDGDTELEELYNGTVTITSGELNLPITNTNQVSASKYTLQLSNPASGVEFYQNAEFRFTAETTVQPPATFGEDVSLNPALSVPGNILIVDSSNSEYNYGSYTIHTDKDYTNYFAVGKSASDVFNIVNNNNAGVYMNSSANSFTGTSDERLKKNVCDIEDKDLENLQQLRPVSYKWKKQTDDTEHYGFIAQEVEKYLPNLVDENTCPDGSTYKGVAVDDLIPYMIKYIQKLKKKIAEKEKEMET